MAELGESVTSRDVQPKNGIDALKVPDSRKPDASDETQDRPRPSRKTILVADDEEHIRHLVRLYFQNEGFSVVEAGSGREALFLCEEHKPDLVILDVMLPGIDGWEVLKELRRVKNVPVIMLTAKDDEIDKVLGLELGADDYVTKPFSPRELVSRVRAVLRRARGAEETADSQRPPDTEGSVSGREKQVAGREKVTGPVASGAKAGELLNYPGLCINKGSREVTVNGQILTGIPPKEFDLLWLLASNPNRVFTRENLLESVWEYTYFGDIRTVDVHIRRLRQKIEKDPNNPKYLKTVWGVGYKFEYHPG